MAIGQTEFNVFEHQEYGIQKIITEHGWNGNARVCTDCRSPGYFQPHSRILYESDYVFNNTQFLVNRNQLVVIIEIVRIDSGSRQKLIQAAPLAFGIIDQEGNAINRPFDRHDVS